MEESGEGQWLSGTICNWGFLLPVIRSSPGCPGVHIPTHPAALSSRLQTPVAFLAFSLIYSPPHSALLEVQREETWA